MAKKTKLPLKPGLGEVPIIAREKERTELVQGMKNGHFPRALIVTGPPGIGKQRLSLWIAQLLICQNKDRDFPCTQCQDCKLIATLSHPDLHFFTPHSSVGGGSLEKQIEKVEEERNKVLQYRRNHALYDPVEHGTAYYVATARTIHRKLSQRSFREKGKRVFVLANAEKLTPHEGSEEAANSMLKVLEEPPEDTYFILTSSSLHRVLGTIRSRCVEFRLPSLSSSEVLQIVRAGAPETSQGDAEVAALQSSGSVTSAQNYLNPEWMEVRKEAVSILTTILTGSPAEKYEIIIKYGFKGARQGFSFMLGHLRDICYQGGKYALTRERKGIDIQLCELIDDAPNIPTPSQWSKIIVTVLEAIDEASHNVSPMLTLHKLLVTASDQLKSH